MSTNAYFQSLYSATTADQTLFNNLIIESIQCHGRDMHYLPRTLTNFDSFFGEDAISAFNSAITLEFFLENVQGWEGDNKFLSKFGLEIRDEATLIVARSRFNEEVTSIFPDIKVPREGDIIVLPSTLDKRTRAFEISYVEGESVFYQIGELYIWKLKIRNFEYNGEAFNTGIQGLDDYETESSIATVIDLSVGVGDFTIGETVTQTNWSGTVIMHSGDQLTVISTAGLFDETEAIVGSSSLTTRMVDGVITETAQDSGNADNQFINETQPSVVNFSEKNPFSEF